MPEPGVRLLILAFSWISLNPEIWITSDLRSLLANSCFFIGTAFLNIIFRREGAYSCWHLWSSCPWVIWFMGIRHSILTHWEPSWNGLIIETESEVKQKPCPVLQRQWNLLSELLCLLKFFGPVRFIGVINWSMLHSACLHWSLWCYSVCIKAIEWFCVTHKQLYQWRYEWDCK